MRCVYVDAGYGHIAPKTTWGRLITILYALVGIPLTFLYLSTIGNFMADCFRLFYKRICCDVCCCKQCARKHKKLQQLRRREIAAQRNEIVATGRLRPPPEPEEVTTLSISAAEDWYPVVQLDNIDDSTLQVLSGSHTSSTAGSTGPTAENFTSGFGAYMNIRETELVDDGASMTSRNDLRGADFRSSPPGVSGIGNDEARRRLLKNFLESKETDIIGDPVGDVTAHGRYRHRSCENSEHETVQSRCSAPTTATRCKTDTEVKIAVSNGRGRLKRQKTVSGVHENGKAKKSSKLQKSKSFSQADESTNRDRVHRIVTRNKSSAPQSILNEPAPDSGGVTGSRQPSTNLTKSASKSTRINEKTAAKGPAEGPDTQSRSVFSVSNGRVNNRKRKLVRSHSSKMSKTEKRPLRRNVTVTATDAGVGGLAVGNWMRKIRREMTSPRLLRQGSVVSSEVFEGSQESFVTAHGDSLLHIDSDTPRPSCANRRRQSTSDDDDNDDDVSLTCNRRCPSPNSTNTCRCEKSGGGAPTFADGQGPVVFPADDADPEDDVMLGHVDEAKVSVPISICLIIIAAYIVGGSALFATWEGWDYVTGSYFCFITLSTIGFGDVVPGTDMDQWSSHEKLVLCALWLAFGLSLLAMCFNLMQEEVKEKCTRIGRKLGLLKADK